jgi:hypothetical protein
MMVHEFQAKELLSCYGLVSPGGKVAITGQEAENIARGFSSGSIVVKAQVHLFRGGPMSISGSFQRSLACLKGARSDIGSPIRSPRRQVEGSG